MKKYSCAIFLSILALISIPLSGFCAEVQNQNELRLDISDDDDNIYLNRTSINYSFGLPFKEKKILSSIFFEPRWDFHIDQWYRIELGIEFGMSVFKWLYLGESLQYAWLRPGDNVSEAETRLTFDWPLNFGFLSNEKTKLQAFEEHTFNMEEGAGTRNEVGLMLLHNLTKHSKVSLGWRHVDRIHDYDSDQITASIILTL